MTEMKECYFWGDYLLRDNKLVWSGLVWSGLVWSGLVWSGLVWSGLVWSGLVKSVPFSAIFVKSFLA